MGNESGTWVMYGVDWNDPECIHTVEEATEYINRIGFLPLFKNDIPGFSLEERTVPEYWWSDDVDKDPWLWRTVIVGYTNIGAIQSPISGNLKENLLREVMCIDLCYRRYTRRFGRFSKKKLRIKGMELTSG